MQQPGEPLEIARTAQDVPHLAGQVAQRAEYVDVLAGDGRLPLEDAVGVPGLPGVDQKRHRSSSAIVSSRQATGSTSTEPSGWNRM